MKVKDLFSKFDNVFHVAEQEEYDNSGAQITFPDEDVKKIYVTLDVTSSSVQRAIDGGCNVLLSHHPLFFSGVKSFDASNPDGKCSIIALSKKLSVYSAHTSLDICDGGLNYRVAKLVGIRNPERLAPREGFIGAVEESTLETYVGQVKKALGDNALRYAGDRDRAVKTVAVVNGSGGRDEDIVALAIDRGADLFISSEFKHSVIRYALERGCAVIELTHFSSELPFVELAREMIEKDCAVSIVTDEENRLFN